MLYGLWSILQANGSIPHSREGATATVIDNNLYIFGGFSRDLFNDIKILDMNHMRWRMPNNT